MTWASSIVHQQNVGASRRIGSGKSPERVKLAGNLADSSCAESDPHPQAQSLPCKPDVMQDWVRQKPVDDAVHLFLLNCVMRSRSPWVMRLKIRQFGMSRT
jgi:hypothetical protein